jgi:uncharacterized membrane protein YbhN (UPF0104 family)
MTLRIVLRALLAVGLLALAAHWVGFERLERQLRAVDRGVFAGAVALAALAQIGSALRWAMIARALGLKAPAAPLLIAYAQGIAVNVLLPGATLGGDALRSVRLQRLGNPLAVAALSVLIDRLSGLWVLCVLSALALGAWLVAPGPPGEARASAGEAGLLAAYLAGLLLLIVAPWLPWRAPPAALAGTGATAGAASEAAAGGLRRRLAQLHRLTLARRAELARSLWGSIGVQALSAAALWLCLRATGATPSYCAVLAIAAPVFIAAALPMSIGGFGPREVAAMAIFPLIGVAAARGLAAAALYGVAAVILGLCAAPLLALPSPAAAPAPPGPSGPPAPPAPAPLAGQTPAE